MSDVITVGGLPGTGTSTLCRILEGRLGLPYTYAGAIFRAEAERRGMSLSEFGALCQGDPDVDQALDAQQADLLQESVRGEGLILEGRLSGWIAYQHQVPALKVWVICDETERIRRIMERDGGDLAVQRARTREREASEADRYRRYYGIDLGDLSPYDLVLDSTSTAPDALADQVEAALRARTV